MARFEQSDIAECILHAPGWVRLGITAPASHLRHDAANELAQLILDHLSRQPDAEAERRQLGLSL